MAKSAFISFHFSRDHWRANQVRNISALAGQPELPSNEWEAVKKRGDAAVEAWIDEQMNYKSAVVVLVGKETASRKFVKYEIRRAWSMKKPLLGIRIHGLKDSNQTTDSAGANPFAQFGFSDSSKTYADYVPLFDPREYTGLTSPTSNDIYAAIKENLAVWASSGYRRP
ncbi:molecular chaperone Tir [Pimelobacter simplex]|uniref:TIR domain-containing protein n=1 Tax=Nocardioides simplex TaxID=2045 RepID=UPI0005362D91|nr:TIR domain-containing protein [Pimelobacter simplex]MCG8151242.1 molecular chaperone Tir [Pimelobacter simplex]GEB12205.1 hypothetical protein NSI01_05200 [Pimelobacter simplex]SFN16714.1 MTH538 TIR-like domain [Pimelobacter simplex]